MCLCLIISLVSALVFLVSVIFKLDGFVLLLVVWFRLLVSSVFVSVFVGFWVIMLDMCLLAGIHVSKIFVMAWLQMLQNSLEQCNMSLLIVCVEMMQISSLCSKLEKFVLLFVLLFLFLGYNYNFFKKKNEAFEFWYLILLWFFYSWSCLQQFLGFKVTLLSWVFLVLYSALAYRFVFTISHGRFCLTLWELLDLKVL